ASCLPVSSSRVRQYLGPVAPDSFSRTSSSSRWAGLISAAEISVGFESLVLDIRFRNVSLGLPVTCGATGDVLRRAQVIFLSQSFAQRELAGKRSHLSIDFNQHRMFT